MNLEHLEKEGERKVAALIAAEVLNEGAPNEGAPNEGAPNEGAPNEGALMAIINEGNDAFKSVHGRNMTYAEMRGMYG
jgi:hypothetical protein